VKEFKTAICFAGTCRSIEHTINNIKEKLLRRLPNADLFFLVSKTKHIDKAYRYLKLNKDVIMDVRDDLFYEVDNYKWHPIFVGYPEKQQVYMRMLYSRQILGEILVKHTKKNNIVYDRVIFSRLDVKYFDNVDSHIEKLNLDNLYIPDFHSTFGGAIDGYNDRFAISNQENMLTYFNAPESLEEYRKTYKPLSAEPLLKLHMNHNNIKVKQIPIRFTRVRPMGEEIDLRLKNHILNKRDT
jgi:hypothetical protein